MLQRRGGNFSPFFFGAFFFSQRDSIFPLWRTSSPASLPLFLLTGLFVAAGLASFYRFYPSIIALSYRQRGPRWLNGLIQNRDRYPLERYLDLRGKVFAFVCRISFCLSAYLLLCYCLSRAPAFYWNQLKLFGGFSLAVVLLTAPNVLENLRGYWAYWYTPKKSCHFLLYKDFFEKIGKPISANMRGDGLRWVLCLFMKNTPFHMALYSMSLGMLGYFLYVAPFSWKGAGIVFAVVFLSVSPIAYGEWTRSPQFARPYFPGMLGLLVLIGFVFFKIDLLLYQNLYLSFWLLIWGTAAVSFLWNLWVFLGDVLPARMAPAYLGRVLEKLPRKPLYTYETPYNNAFAYALQAAHGQKYPIQHIQSLVEAKDGYLLIPGTSSKCLNIEGYEEAIRQEDFNADPLLTHLIESREILQLALAKFKTLGTSKVWALDSEMPSYRMLILKDITEKDRWRGRGWILDASRFNVAQPA